MADEAKEDAKKSGPEKGHPAAQPKSDLVPWAQQKVPVVTSDDPAYSALGAASGLLMGAMSGVVMLPGSLSEPLWATAFGIVCVGFTGLGAAATNILRRWFSKAARAYAKYQRDLQAIEQAQLPPERAAKERAAAYDRYCEELRPVQYRFAEVESSPTGVRIAEMETQPESPDENDPQGEKKKLRR